MALTLEFLNWDKPFIPSVASFLLSRNPEDKSFDLRRFTVILPGARAGRRLIDILTEKASISGEVLLPPRVLTAGHIPELLYTPSLTPAKELEKLLLRSKILSSTPSEEIKALLPFPPQKTDLQAWLMLSKAIESLYTELSSACLSFLEVGNFIREQTDLPDDSRWDVLDSHQKRYLKELAELGLSDLQAERMQALLNESFFYEGELIFAGTADLSGLNRKFISKVKSPVTSLVFAPSDKTSLFDEFGCIKVSTWLKEEIPIKDSQICIASTPSDQAQKAIAFFSNLDSQFDPSEITIGTGDTSLEPWIMQSLEEANLEGRPASGKPLNETAPFIFLKALSSFLSDFSFSDFGTLLRHPDVHSFLTDSDSVTFKNLLASLDEWQGSHLQARIKGLSFFGDPVIKKAYSTIETLLGDLLKGQRPLHEWAQPVADSLHILSKQKVLKRFNSEDKITIEALEIIADSLGELASLPSQLSTVVNASTALGILISLLAGQNIPYESNHYAIKISGWLELLMDDSPCLAVSGFNEGLIPEAVSADMFLPNSVRSRLGLTDNEKRYARDAFSLSAILNSKAHFLAIAGTTDSDGSPLKQSRLLFALPPDKIPARVKLVYNLKEEPPPAPLSSTPAKAFKLPVKPSPLEEPVTRLPVSAFKGYLDCPYRFYLSHILRLETLDDLSPELDALSFGNLAHEVLAEFGRDACIKTSTDSSRIEEYLNLKLDELFEKTFGTDVFPTVMIQKEQMKGRFSAFAKWQAEWAKQGWIIEDVEKPFSEGNLLKIETSEGKEITVTGRIDRIDFNPATKEWLIFDYKTGDKGDRARTSHLSKSGEWRNLQLPLYTLWFLEQKPSAIVNSGYMRLAAGEKDIGEDLANFTKEDLDSAHQQARKIATAISGEIFWPPSDDIPADTDPFALVCGNGQLLDGDAVSEGGDE